MKKIFCDSCNNEIDWINHTSHFKLKLTRISAKSQDDIELINTDLCWHCYLRLIGDLKKTTQNFFAEHSKAEKIRELFRGDNAD